MFRGQPNNPQWRDMAPLWPKTNDDFLRKIDELIRSNISNEYFGATELSNKLGVSISYLNRVLNERIGISAGKLIRNTRMNLAYKLITESDLPVKNIGIQVGYLQQANFTRAFVNKYQKTPSSFRSKDISEIDFKIDWESELSIQEIEKVIAFLLSNRQIAIGVRELCEQIENPEYKITELANSCSMSKSQLNRMLTKHLNVSTALFIRYLKISYVVNDLCHSNKDITQLIYGVNFFDTAYFNKCFKKVYRITPRAYRKHNSEKSIPCFFTEIVEALKNDKIMHL